MQTKHERLTFKVLPAHKAALRSLALAEGEAMSVVMRNLIKEAAKKKGIWQPELGIGGEDG